MTELNDLILKIEKGILSDAGYIKTIKNPQLLVTALKELNDVIGNHDVKNSIALQISHLIMEKRRAFDNPDVKEDDSMLNTILYGPPGVGKTLIGTKLAKIWSALGYLDDTRRAGEKTKSSPTDIKSVISDLLSGTTTTSNETNNSFDILFLIGFFILLFIIGVYIIWSIFTNYGSYMTMLFIIVFIIFIIFISSIVVNSFSTTSGTTGSTGSTGATGSTGGVKKEENIFTPSVNNVSDEEVIRVVSRSDFVDKYVGHTAIKTNNLLRENTGKVLFIDEAYSLLHGVHDEFGMEALTALNLYMSQHPRKTLVIMAGYKDLLEDGIFSAQPGLQRRFMWQFDCAGYNAKELATIFLFQIRSSGWEVEKEDEVFDLIADNEKKFPAYGGDTSKLTFYSKLEHSKEYMKNSKNMGMNVLTIDNIQKGLVKLESNNIQTKSKNENIPVNPLSALMKAFKTQTA